MRCLRFLFLLATGGLLSPLSHATSVRPPQPDDLIGQAEWVATGTVSAIRCEERTNPAGTALYTIVTFAVNDAIMGTPPTTAELVFLGGEANGRGLKVVGQPEFAVGDEELLFVAHNGEQLCPLVRMTYGRFRVIADETPSATRRLYRQDFSPLTRLTDTAKPLRDEQVSPAPAPTTPAGMTLADFRLELIARARATGRTDVHDQIR